MTQTSLEPPTSTGPLGELVTTADGTATLRHPDLGEEYHSRDGARFETDELYMRRSGFLTCLAAGDEAATIGILDVGLGLGFNALATIEAWFAADAPPSLALFSLEINADLVRELATGTPLWGSAWNDDWRAWAKGLHPATPHLWRAAFTHASGASLAWTVWVGDAATEAWEADVAAPFAFVWQDAFSPRKNPTLWTADWFARVKAVSTPAARLMTYSAARAVKDGLAGGGWAYAVIPAVGTKRHWLTAAWEAGNLAVGDGRGAVSTT